jgi:3-methyladenine DNA glycosylase/8-oxoguanine DNA glycosylase
MEIFSYGQTYRGTTDSHQDSQYRLVAPLRITHINIATTDVSDIHKCSLLMCTAGYIKSLGDSALDGKLDLMNFCKLSDREIIKKLSSLHGLWI